MSTRKPLTEDQLARRRERDSVWREKNRDSVRAYNKKYQLEHRDRLRAQQAANYQANKPRWQARGKTEAVLAYNRAYHRRHRVRMTAWQRRWRDRNRVHFRAVQRAWRLKNVDKKRARDRSWRERNPEKYRKAIAAAKAANPTLYKEIQRTSWMARRARLAGTVVEQFSVREILSRDRGVCHLCLSTVAPGETSLDHLIPVVRDGALAAWNLMLAHRRCNQRRGIKQVLPVETRVEAERYIQARVTAYQESAA